MATPSAYQNPEVQQPSLMGGKKPTGYKTTAPGTPSLAQKIMQQRAAQKFAAAPGLAPGAPEPSQAVLRTNENGQVVGSSWNGTDVSPAVLKKDTSGRVVGGNGQPLQTGDLMANLDRNSMRGRMRDAGMLGSSPSTTLGNMEAANKVLADSMRPANQQISYEQAMAEGQAQGRYGFTGPATPGIMAYDREQQARRQRLADSQAQVNGIPINYSKQTRIMRGMGEEPRDRLPMPAEKGPYQRPPLNPEIAGKMMDSIVRSAENRDARQAVMEKIAAGTPEARPGLLGALMDKIAPQKGFDMNTLSDSEKKAYGQQMRMNEAVAKRQRYLSGTGEYAGRGPEERAAARDYKRRFVTANAIADSDARRWRMSGGPQQQAMNNAMMMRNPGIAMEMIRANAQMQENNLNREIQREELAMRREELRGIRNDRRAERLDNMKMERDRLGLQREGLGIQSKESDRRAQQDQNQHDELMGRYNLEDRRREEDKAQALEDKIAARRIQLQEQGMSDAEIERDLDTNFPGRKKPKPPGDPGSGGDAGPQDPQEPLPITVDPYKPRYRPGDEIPRELRNIGVTAAKNADAAGFKATAKARGYDDYAIDMMWRKLVNNPQASIEEPEGQSLGGALWDIITGQSPTNGQSKWERWKSNRGNRP